MWPLHSRVHHPWNLAAYVTPAPDCHRVGAPKSKVWTVEVRVSNPRTMACLDLRIPSASVKPEGVAHYSRLSFQKTCVYCVVMLCVLFAYVITSAFVACMSSASFD